MRFRLQPNGRGRAKECIRCYVRPWSCWLRLPLSPGGWPMTRLRSPPHTVVGMDSVMEVDTVSGLDTVAALASAANSAGAISAVLAGLSAVALRVSTFPQHTAGSAALGASHPAWMIASTTTDAATRIMIATAAICPRTDLRHLSHSFLLDIRHTLRSPRPVDPFVLMTQDVAVRGRTPMAPTAP
jgi:hypothetical protein